MFCHLLRRVLYMHAIFQPVCACVSITVYSVLCVCVCVCLKLHDGEERRLRCVRDESTASLLGAVSLLPGVTSTPLAHLLSSLRQTAATLAHTRTRTHTHTQAAEESVLSKKKAKQEKRMIRRIDPVPSPLLKRCVHFRGTSLSMHSIPSRGLI